MNRARPLARIAAALATTTALLGASPAWAEFRLNILHLNDPHSRIEPINRFDSTCSAEDDAAGECFGGFARLKTAIAERKEALNGPTVVVSAGDHFQGSLFYTTYKGAGEAEMAEAIGVELMTLGNHEFDDGDAELGAFLDGVSFPVLGANVDASRSDAVGDRIDPYVIAEFDDAEGETQRVGFVGVVASDTAETSSPGPNIDIGDDLDALREAVAALEMQGVNKIIAVTHVGLARDRELAAAVPEIDLIIGGHSHTLLSNEADDVEGGAEPYPVVVDDTPIVQAYAYGKYLGEMVLRFDDEGVLQSLAGDPVLIDASFAKDEALDARIQDMLGPIEALKAMEVGEATATIDGSRETCRAGECAMGNLVADAMLDRVADQGIDVAIQNGGGLRASIDAGTITMGEVLTVLPFQNTLATFELTGADIVASLENGVGQIEEGAGRFPQVAGMSFAFDPAAEPGARVSDVMVGGKPIDMDATYGVVSNNFMRGGGDGYELFASRGTNAYDFGPGLERVVADYIAKTGPITPGLDGRIVDLSTDTADDAADADTTDEDMVDAEVDDQMVAAEAAADEVAAGADTSGDDAAGDDGVETAGAPAMAVQAINEAVEGATDTAALSAPPAIVAETEAAADTTPSGDATPASETDAAAATGVSDVEAPTTGSESDAAAAAGVADAAPMADDAMPENADAVAEGAVEAATAEEVLADAPAPTADTDAVQEAVEAVADAAPDAEAMTDGGAEAAAAINDAVAAATDTSPLAEAPVIEVEAADTTMDADGVDEGPVTDEVAASDRETAEEVVAEVPAPTADTDAVQEAVEEVADAASDAQTLADENAEQAAAAINDAVAATTDTSPLAEAPAIEVETADAIMNADEVAEGVATDAEGAAADAATAEEVVAEVPAPTADTEAVQEAVEEVADAASDTEATTDQAASAAAAINDAVEAATAVSPLAEAPVIEVEAVDATASDAADDAEGTEVAAEGEGTDAATADEVVADAPAPTADTGAVQEAIEEVADTASDAETMAEGNAEQAAAAINDAVAAATDTSPLAEAPVIEVETADASMNADDAAEGVVADAEGTTAAADGDVADAAAIEEVVADAPTPTADTDAVQEAVEEVADTASDPEATTDDGAADAAAAINDAVEAVTDASPLAEAPVIEGETADVAAEEVVADVPAPTADTDAVQEAAEDVAADASDEAADESTDDTSTGEASVEVDGATSDGEPRTYTVRDGDTFWSIAGEVYGDPTLFPLLVEANEERARRLQIGTEIVIPERAE